jgi:hypothetical protein
MTAKRKHVAKEGHWRVYGLKHPMDFEGNPYRPPVRATWKSGWFWIKRGDEGTLYVRVYGLEVARAICRQLNAGAPRRRQKLHPRAGEGQRLGKKAEAAGN